MDGIMKFFAVLALVVLVVMFVGSAIAGSAAEGFAKGGGDVRLLSPETYSSATAGDNGVAVAIQGDRNSIALAYSNSSQPTPVPDHADDKREADLGRAAAAGAFATVAAGVVVVTLALLLFGGGGGKKYQ